MNEDKIVQNLAGFKQHSEINAAIQLIGKSKLKKGSERCKMLAKAKETLFPFSGDKTIFQAINDLSSIS